MGKKVIDLTVVVTAHKEGLLAHKTMCCVFENLKKLEDNGYSAEIIIHIDNGDEDTKRYYSRYKKEQNIKIFQNSFGDTGSSRNFAAQKASGKYIAFFDGDDLVSDNWLETAIKILENSKNEIIVHPEAVLTFGLDLEYNVLTIQKPSCDKDEDTRILLGENRWCSMVAMKTSTALNNPYPALTLGYGHEDFVFDIETVYKKIKHVIAKKTVLFYRRSDKSRLSTSNQDNATIPYVKLFDFDEVKKIKTSSTATARDKVQKRGYKLYKKIRGNKYINYFITPIAKKIIKQRNRKIVAQDKIPDFVIQEWVKINHIEKQLYPHSWIVDAVKFYDAKMQLPVGDAYIELARGVRYRPDYVFILPWLKKGGADKVTLNYIHALHEINKKWRFTIITTLPDDNAWVEKLPDYVDHIDFGNIANGLVPNHQEALFTRLIVQLNCKNIHIINSEYGYVWARKHQTLLKNEYNLNLSLFCSEYIPGSKMQAKFSYCDPYTIAIYDAVKNIFTDNTTMIDSAMIEDGFYDNKFKVHYQPVINLNLIQPKQTLVEKKKIKILWASRVVPTKLPELVERIGKQLDYREFQIDVYGEKSQDVRKNIFKGIRSINYKGTYDGFSSIPTQEYDILLYTAKDDGVPNVILEATAAGLPIIASNDGGVGEFIRNGKTGILIEDFLNPTAYVEALREVFNKPEDLPKYVKAAQDLLMQRHSWEKFVEVVRKDIAVK